MPPKRASPSVTPVPTTEGAVGDGSALPNDQWIGMQWLLDYIYDYRLEDGYDPSKVFHRNVNKRVVPGYYEMIKEPMALSTIKAKIKTRAYKSFAEFVRDFALIPHNAQVFNRPTAGAYQDGLVIKEQLQLQLKKMADTTMITDAEATLPFLGEIPTQDEEPAEEEEEEDDEEEDEEEGEDSEEEPKPRKRGRPRLSTTIKREGASKGDGDKQGEDQDTRKKRGRPPKVHTPMEARIQAVLKGIRKPKNSLGQSKIGHFERLPDKSVMPEYFNEIRSPMAFDMLKRKLKRKKYVSLDQFMVDVDLMFENAKSYNQDESQIFRDAVELQAEAHRLADEERSKPDTEYVMDEGRIPMPNGILHNGELYKVGDWVLIQNANDLTKPIPAQVYRTWQDKENGKWVNVCWYYRPEQTVHRFDKHFLDNEVVKTGQYRDHRVDEIIGRCFIMFTTRYFKGRPRNLPSDMEIFVCEARYNEEKLTFNKIKTWASCLPDEVRDKDYEMSLFDGTRKMRKFPSPIAYLLKDEQKETDDMPKPEWGAENAPPKVGAVHRRLRDPRDSLPPEPTPSPPPQPAPTPAAAPVSLMSAHNNSYASIANNSLPMAAQSPARPTTASRTSYTASHPQQYSQPLNSPGQSQQRAMSNPRSIFQPATPQQMSNPNVLRNAAPASNQIPPPNPYHPPQSSNYRGPPPIEVYVLPDAANNSIPAEIRSRFQQDEQGHVLFFTAPPVHLAQDDDGEKSTSKLGHSIKYLAEKSRRAEQIALKRKEHEAVKAQAQAENRKRTLEEEAATEQEMTRLKRRALEMLEKQLSGAIRDDWSSLYGEGWKGKMDEDLETLSAVQKETIARHATIEKHVGARADQHQVLLGSGGTLLDNAEAGLV